MRDTHEITLGDRSWIRFAETGDPGWPVHGPAGGHVQHIGVA
ncbi:hypothetical protein ACGFX2_16795 [Streptomyces goshikiensis]